MEREVGKGENVGYSRNRLSEGQTCRQNPGFPLRVKLKFLDVSFGLPQWLMGKESTYNAGDCIQ